MDHFKTNVKNKIKCPKNSKNYLQWNINPKYLDVHSKAADIAEVPGVVKI